MYFARVPALVVSVVACLASTSTAFVAIGGSALRSSLGRTTFSPKHVHAQGSSNARQQSRPRPIGVQSLRASAEDEEGGGGFKNPYTAFRQWQMDLIESKAKSNDKYPEAFEGLMKEPGMTEEKADRLAKLSVSDPILYAIERRKEANEINDTPMDYNKISGFFPMEWIMTGDFGWGFNKKKARLAKEAAEAAEEEAASSGGE